MQKTSQIYSQFKHHDQIFPSGDLQLWQFQSFQSEWDERSGDDFLFLLLQIVSVTLISATDSNLEASASEETTDFTDPSEA